MIKDGWHTVKGFEVYVEDGHIIRGTSGEGVNYKTTYPYRSAREGGWEKGEPTVSAFKHENWTMI
jgi:hypothetical protein